MQYKSPISSISMGFQSRRWVASGRRCIDDVGLRQPDEADAGDTRRFLLRYSPHLIVRILLPSTLDKHKQSSSADWIPYSGRCQSVDWLPSESRSPHLPPFRSKGAFGGLTFEGAGVEQDDDSTRAIYGRKVSFRTYRQGGVHVTASTAHFMAAGNARAQRQVCRWDRDAEQIFKRSTENEMAVKARASDVHDHLLAHGNLDRGERTK